jgi:hypothetical protein
VESKVTDTTVKIVSVSLSLPCVLIFTQK